MTIAIEPMITLGDYEVKWMPDGWTVVTADKSLAAHYENTILILCSILEAGITNESVKRSMKLYSAGFRQETSAGTGENQE